MNKYNKFYEKLKNNNYNVSHSLAKHKKNKKLYGPLVVLQQKWSIIRIHPGTCDDEMRYSRDAHRDSLTSPLPFPHCSRNSTLFSILSICLTCCIYRQRSI